ncbi:MAG TPA: S8 family serine peptidase, partial [Chitinophagaceae bacterium]
ITAINALPFVQTVVAVAARIASTNDPVRDKYILEKNFTPIVNTSRTTNISADFYDYGSYSFNEINLHKGQFLHNIGLRGQGMQIAMLDNGFTGYTYLPSFDSINTNAQVLGTWDFVNREATVNNDGTHGMQCMSTIAANIPGHFIGKAPKANFWLFKTEDDASEYPIEEFNWACGAERADSSGTDVITSSLGYGYDFDGGVPNYLHSMLDGNTTMSAIAADLAAKKGILVFNSAGNEGGSSFHFITSPADGDSVVAVGAVSSSGVVGAFSSYGPSGDGQIKPDVASVGVAALIQPPSAPLAAGNGTSYACPNMAGLGTVLWQGFPEVNNMRIVRALREAGSIASSPNDRIGYGIPDLKSAFGTLLTEFATSSSTINGCRVFVNWTSKDVGAMKYEIERKGPGDINFTKLGELTPAAGVSLATHSYEFINTLATGASGSFSYRIRQIIDTAAATFTAVYVDTTVANLASPCVVTGVVNPGTINNYVVVRPNPSIGATATLIIETTDAIQNMPILVYNMNGRLVQRLQETKGSGKKIIDLPLSKLARGKYFINVYNKNVLIGTAEFIRL